MVRKLQLPTVRNLLFFISLLSPTWPPHGDMYIALKTLCSCASAETCLHRLLGKTIRIPMGTRNNTSASVSSSRMSNRPVPVRSVLYEMRHFLGIGMHSSWIVGGRCSLKQSDSSFSICARVSLPRRGMLIDFGATATSASEAMEPDIKKGLLLFFKNFSWANSLTASALLRPRR